MDDNTQNEDTNARLRRLEDHVALYQLVSQYGPSVDSNSPDKTANLWTEDGVYAVYPSYVMEVREAISDMVNGNRHQSYTLNGAAHITTLPYIELHEDEAVGTGYQILFRRNQEEGSYWVFRVVATRWEWIRCADGWKTQRRSNRLLDGNEEARALLGLIGSNQE